MEKFLLLIREDLLAREKMTKEEFDRNIQLMTKWIESMAESGNFINAENTEQAASIAQSCPLVLNDTAVIEVRPVMIIENESSN